MRRWNIYKSKPFAMAWNNHQKQKPDYPRLILSNPVMEKNLGNLTGKVVLDAGCGNGFFLRNILKKNPRQAYAVDISRHLVEIAKGKIKSEKVRYKVCDLTKRLPFKKDFFDAIVSYNVLVDMPKIGTAFREMHRTLKKKGKAIICLVHPLYNLFVNDKAAQSETVFERLKRYAKTGRLRVTTIPGFDDFIGYRRPIEEYVAAASNAGFIIKKIFPITVSEAVAQKDTKYASRKGLPIFLFMELEKPENS